ncbi:MAG: hypothetical protein QNJ98_03840 [Planctomycetota bacterium]|nr:hypothetical protein [Planctomycetota bacterium]
MSAEPAPAAPPVLGRGRSGVVFRAQDEGGREIVRKVFGAHGVTKLAQIVLLGAPNPYAWDEHAIACADLRRRILVPLVDWWFGDHLRVAAATGHAWNESERAYELHAEFIDGRHAPLRHPLRLGTRTLIRELTREVMPALAKRLEQAGFDGLVWQAGRGNPVAWNNFLMEERPDGSHRWVWIDLESGVPALAPLNPLTLFTFYLPRCLKHRGALFDDVDMRRLEAYVETHRDELRAHVGDAAFEAIQRDTAALAAHQTRWKGRSRLQRSLRAQERSGRIDEAEVAYYRTRPLRWYGRLAREAVGSVGRKVGRAIAGLGRSIIRFPLWSLFRAGIRFLVSQEYRMRLARNYGLRRIDRWRTRGQMTEADHATLEADIHGSEASLYMTDFGFHLATKPFVKAAEWWLAPALFAAGAIDGWTLAAMILLLGPLVRTVYTLVRLAQATVRGRRRPWIALFTGAIPVVGNFAYPLQLLYSGTGGGSRVGEMILDDAFASLGRRVPIWGGADTGVEHVLNRVPGWIAARLRWGGGA